MGPSMASGNQQCKPNCVDLLNKQIKKQQHIAKNTKQSKKNNHTQNTWAKPTKTQTKNKKKSPHLPINKDFIPNFTV
jgi:hypothetical protein